MRTGVVTSTAIHAALLTWGLWSLGAPKPLEAQYAEALPVEVIMSDTFEGVKGEKKAPLAEKPAPKPTAKPQTLPMDARNFGDNEVDLESPPVPDAKPAKVESKPQPKAADLPPPEPKPKPKPEPKVAEKTPPPTLPTPTPPKEEPKKQPEPPKVDPLAEAIQKAEDVPDPKPEEKPKPVPKPAVKPTPPKQEVAEAKPEPKKTDSKAKEKPKKDVAEKASDSESEFNVADISALINKAKPAGGGAKRSTEAASLGSKETTGTKLSRSQIGELQGMIREQMEKCWNPPAGLADAGDMKVSIKIKFDPSGELDGVPQIVSGGGGGTQNIAAEAAMRAIRRCAPFNLPADLYAGGWDVTTINFDPSEMF